MVSFKGKETRSSLMATRIHDENRAPKSDFKMAGDQSRKVTGKVPMVGSRKLGPLSSSSVATSQINFNRCKGKVQSLENAMGKRGSSVKVRSGRKALADVSNLNNNKTSQHRIELSNKPKIMKEKLVGNNILQGKTTTGSNTHRPRVSLTKSVMIANVSSKPIKENMRSLTRATGRLNIHVEASIRSKTCTEINSCQGRQTNPSVDSSKLIKNQGLKLSRPRLSFATQKALDGNISSRKPLGTKETSMHTNSKFRRAPMAKHKSDVGISITSKACENKVTGEANNSGPGDNESVNSQGCGLPKAESDGSSCSNDNVRAIISKPKCNRRKSYTSSLVARSEVQNQLPANYMAAQSDITPRMRGILVNWLIEVHLKFHLMQETLFLMVQLLDRVLSVLPIKKDQLQMVGLTALLLASKYEDYWHPKISELISISANVYSRDQILSMEKLVLRKLSFRLNLPTPYVFMLRFLKAAQSDKKLEHLSFYLIELCLGEYEALEYRSSLMCASAIYVARCTLHVTPAWTGLLRKYARYEESQLRACAEMILRFHQAACLKPTKITYEKYSTLGHSCVAALTPMDVLPS